MRVALDLTPATTGSTGVSRYARCLYDGLQPLDVEVVPFAVGRGPHPPPPGTHRCRAPLRVVQRSWSLTRRPAVERWVGSVDLMHCLDLVPAPSRAPTVMTAHDLLALTRPELHSPSQVDQQRAQLRALLRADLVLANSEVTGQQLVDHGVRQDRVVVTRLGCAPPPSDVKPYPGRYVLAVGELAARKNLGLLAEAFLAARLPQDVRLLLAGPDGHAAASVRALLGDRVRALGRVDDATLASLYAGATAFCFPSLAEGFGLPVLEAMRAGAPVLASDLPILHEVAGDAARFLSPYDATAWASALEELVADPASVQELREQGRTHAAGMTWDATARATLDAYRSLLS